MINRLSALDAGERARGVAGASAGNHAIALAWGAAAEGIDCAVFSWPGGSRFQLDRARALGAVINTSAEDPQTLLRSSRSTSPRPDACSSTPSTTRA